MNVTPATDVDPDLDRLLDMIAQTNVIAIDKLMAAIRRAPHSGYTCAAQRAEMLTTRIMTALVKIRLCLPADSVDTNLWV